MIWCSITYYKMCVYVSNLMDALEMASSSPSPSSSASRYTSSKSRLTNAWQHIHNTLDYTQLLNPQARVTKRLHIDSLNSPLYYLASQLYHLNLITISPHSPSSSPPAPAPVLPPSFALPSAPSCPRWSSPRALRCPPTTGGRRAGGGSDHTCSLHNT